MHALAWPGHVVADRYRLQDQIGRGAMGTVWRARDELLDRDVAVKEVKIPPALSPGDRSALYERTLREARTAARLNHPGVVTVFDVVEEDGRPWIIMELVQARSLDQVLAEDGPLPVARAADIGSQLVSALTTAHAAGVLHRDVKPSNVLLCPDGRAVLTDFGIAKLEGEARLTQTGMVMGTPEFTPPERIRGEPATPASDLWSLGATLYAAVQGRGPYQERGGAITTMNAVIHEDTPVASSAGQLGPVISALMCKDPAARPDAAGAARMLAGAMSGGTRGGAAGTPGGAAGTPGGMSGAAGNVPGAPGGMPYPGSTVPTGPGAPVPGGSAPGGPAPDGPAPGGPVPGGPVPRGPVPGRPGGSVLGGPVPGGLVPGGPGGSVLGGPVLSAPVPPGVPWPAGAPWPNGAPELAGRNLLPYAPRSGPGIQAAPGSTLYAAPVAEAGAHASRRTGRTTLAICAAAAIVAAGVLGGFAIAHFARSSGTPRPRGKSGTSHTTTRTSTGSSSSPSGASSTATTAPATTAPAAGLPAGYTWYSQPGTAAGTTAGFRMAVPSGWQASRSGLVTDIKDPSGTGFIEVDLTPHTYPNDMAEAHWLQAKTLSQHKFPSYRRIALRPTEVAGSPGAVWTFSWLDRGTGRHIAQDYLFNLPTEGTTQSYAVYTSAPRTSWSQTVQTITEAIQSFQLLP